jgi:hypothetical protein
MSKNHSYVKLLREQLIGAIAHVEIWEANKSHGNNAVYAARASDEAIAKCRQRISDLELQIAMYEPGPHA